MLKIFRRVQAGRASETEMSRYLTEHGFANSPTLLGEIVRVDADGMPQTLMIAEVSFATRAMPGTGRWTWVRRGVHARRSPGPTTRRGREAISRLPARSPP